MMPQSNRPPVRRHLIIAGSGGAGTTSLVRYLAAAGLDTHLSRRGQKAGDDSGDRPYVIENPMLVEFIDEVLADESIALDGVIIPMRDSNEATGPATRFDVFVERLVRANVPLVLLDSPRIVNDAGYLHDKLAGLVPKLPPPMTSERNGASEAAGQPAVLDVLVREIDHLRAQITDLEKLRQRAWKDAAALQIELDQSARQLQTIAPENALLKSRNILLAAQIEVVMAERGALEAYCHRLEETASDARARAIAAERSMHEYLAAFVDDAGSLLTPIERAQLLRDMRGRVASLVKQLEVTQQDLAATMTRLEEREAEATTAFEPFRRSLRGTASG